MGSFSRDLLSSTALTRMSLVSAGVLLASHPAMALPQGGSVAGGSASIVQTSPTQLTVNQTSGTAVLDWRSFSIGQNETTSFNQPSSSAIAINRVTGVDPSQIAGHLNANGQVVLINPNGVLFTKSAEVNVGGLVASTSSITTANAMSGTLAFDQSSSSKTATVVNRGTITAAQGGLVALVAPGVANSGVITAKLGRVSLASGDKWTLDLYGDHLVSFAVNDQVANAVAGPDGTGVGVSHTGSIVAAGGTVELTANVAKGIVSNAINMGGVIEAASVSTQGGTILLSGGQSGVSITGSMNASGASGGTIAVSGDSVTNQGTLHADGSTGAGGQVTVSAASAYIDTQNAVISASGASQGGTVGVTSGGTLYSAGQIAATSSQGVGGQVTVTGATMALIGAGIDASGFTQGGSISLGGGAHGAGATPHAASVYASTATSLKADATGSGQGGTIAVWSDQSTEFAGQTSAKGGAAGGNGGLIDVSSAGSVTYAGTADASAPDGVAGQLLLDPKTIIVNALTGIFPQFDLVNPNPSVGGSFGSVSVVLSSGNVVVTDPDATIGLGPLAAGAAYLFNGTTGQLISVLTGTHLDDHVGANVTTLTNGNYVVSESTWNGGMGAATWGSGSLGITGSVSAANSLTGSSIGDQVGLSVTALANGNYVVGSPDWSGTKGAATWGNGATGLTGTVSAANSLIGSTAGDEIGLSITTLTNGNYVVGSPDWSDNKGAASWGNGSTGLTGTVSAANSLVGSTSGNPLSQILSGLLFGTIGDQVGLSVTALANGNYVVGSPDWNDNRGAASWGNGTTGLTGTVSTANSLIGSTGALLVQNPITHLVTGPEGDQVGLSVTALTDGNYVVGSPQWNGTVGAATWANGSTGLAGSVSSANSLVGSSAGDEVGLSVTALANGDYVVGSPDWSGDKGAATWGGGAGITGTVSAANSLIGATASDQVGLSVTALANGDYVVGSPDWSSDKGAATWANGSTGLNGTVSASNSLIGSSTSDEVGLSVTALTNGNYVVGSPDWSGDKGAASWASGTLGLTGTVSAANSLIGSSSGDQVGLGVTALTDGNYVIGSPHWDGNTGAASWASGTLGLTGTVSAANSLIGSSTGDEVGLSVSALAGGAYVVASPYWNGLLGAATFGVAGQALTGTIDAANSIEGTVAQTIATLGIGKLIGGAGFLVSFATAAGGEVVEGMQNPNGLTYTDNPSGTITITPQFLTATLDNGTSVTLQANDDIIVDSAIVTTAPGGTGGNLTLEAGRSLLFNAGIVTDNGTLTLVANDTAADGVVNADRDAGNATITMGTGVSFDAGSGAVSIDMNTGAGITNAASGGIVLNAIHAATIDVVDQTTGTLTLDGQLAASGSGNAIVLSTGVIDNMFGSTALSVGAGRYILYSTDPRDNTLDGLTGFIKHYGVTYGGLPPASVSAGADYSFYSVVPTLTLDVNAASQTYGSANPVFGYTPSGLIDGDTIATALSGTPLYSTPATSLSPVGSYAITLSGALTSPLGYDIVLVNGTLTVNQAPLTITANNATKLYGATDPALSATYTGLKNNDGSSVVTGLTLATSGISSSAVGAYAITASGAMAENYSITYGPNGTLSVTPAPLTITAGNATRLYGAANPAFSASYQGFVNGDGSSAVSGLTLSSPATTASNVGTYAIGGAGAMASNYAIIYDSGILSVTPAPLTITASNASRLYGSANPTLSATYQGLLNNDSSAVVSNLTLSTSATSASNVGTYDIAAAGGTAQNYTIAYGPNGTLAVTPAPLTITVNNADRLYGAANPAFSATYSGLVNGDGTAAITNLTLSTSATTASNVGTYAITAANGFDTNYSITYAAGTLTVDKAALTITANNASKLYGAANPTLGATYTGLVNGDGSNAISGLMLSTSATSASSVGSYGITASAATAQNYTISYGPNAILSVTPAPLTIAAENASRLYGAANPAFSATYTGLVNNDASGVVTGLTLASGATTASNTGTYAILGGNAVAANYAITYASGTLSVTPAPLTITAGNATRTYGAANPAFSATYMGLVNSDSSSVVSGLTLSSNATTASSVGGYWITGSGGMAQNYTISYGMPGTLSITPASLTIGAENASRLYGSANPVLSASYQGLMNGDSSAVVSGLSLSTSATTASIVGSYPIQAGGGTAQNYTITYGPNGTLAVDPAPLVITVADQSRQYGAANPALTASYAGFVNGDSSGSVTGLSLSTSATTASHVGVYAIDGTGAAAANYAITYAQGSLSVTPAPLFATADDATRTYGAVNPAFSATYSGFVNGDTTAALGAGFATAGQSANVGTYQIVPQISDADYRLTYTPGILTITPAPLTITPNETARVVDTSNPDFTATFQGLVNGDPSSVVTGLTLTSNATSTSPVGIYQITASGGTSTNYTITYGPSAILDVTVPATAGTPAAGNPPATGGGGGGGTPSPVVTTPAGQPTIVTMDSSIPSTAQPTTNDGSTYIYYTLPGSSMTMASPLASPVQLGKLVSEQPATTSPLLLQAAGEIAAANGNAPYLALANTSGNQNKTICLKLGLTTEITQDGKNTEPDCAAPLSFDGF